MPNNNNLNERSRKFQFIHLEAYSLQANQQGGKNAKFNKEVKARTVSEVLGEVLRKEGFCNHIQEPEAPGVLYGDLNNIEADCKAYHQNHKNIDKNGKTKALRSDANVLIAGVVSLEGIEENYKDWNQYKINVVEFLKEKYGENLAAVVEHTDEENPHLHFYIVPKIGQKLDELHDGKKAVLELKKKEPKALKGKQNKAYIEGMRNFQDDFYNKVSKNFGLTKIGPARSRVSRKTYFEQKKAAEEYRKTLKQIEQNKFFIDSEFEQAKKNIENEIKKEKNNFEKEKRKIVKKVVKETYKETMENYENKNYINKMLFSMTYNKTKILNQEKQISHLIKEGRKHFDRKNEYKKEVSRLKDFEDKYTNLRKDFGKRLNNALGEVKVENDNLKMENQKLRSENENLKYENEMGKYAIEFLNKLKNKLGSKFENLRNEFFPKKQKPSITPQSNKLKI
ncbi:plasmid recombination protein [Citrobacter portucalensis]|uniref:plasmid recombination protein n=5 Tax=Enterobacteriaceae TaxID=543 RepID=UPI002FE5B69B